MILRTPLPLSIATLCQQHITTLKNQWSLRWKKSPCYPRLYRTDPSLPSDSFLRLIKKSTLNHAQTSLLFQLRTHHIPLNLHLHRIKKAESPHCPTCRFARETVHHFLLECPTYNTQWEPPRRRWKHLSQDLPYLLSNPKAIVTVLGYVHATSRLNRILSEPRTCH